MWLHVCSLGCQDTFDKGSILIRKNLFLPLFVDPYWQGRQKAILTELHPLQRQPFLFIVTDIVNREKRCIRFLIIQFCHVYFQALRRIGQDHLILLLCITVFLSYLPEAGEYSCFFIYLRLVSIKALLRNLFFIFSCLKRLSKFFLFCFWKYFRR